MAYLTIYIIFLITNLINSKTYPKSFLLRFPRSGSRLTCGTKVYKITIGLLYLVYPLDVQVGYIKFKFNLSSPPKTAIYNLGIKLIINPNNFKL